VFQIFLYASRHRSLQRNGQVALHRHRRTETARRRQHGLVRRARRAPSVTTRRRKPPAAGTAKHAAQHKRLLGDAARLRPRHAARVPPSTLHNNTTASTCVPKRVRITCYYIIIVKQNSKSYYEYNNKTHIYICYC